MKVKAYVGSAWYRDCDPFMSVAFNPERKRYNTRDKASLKLERLALQSAADDWSGCDSGETKRAYLDSVCTSGVFLEESVTLTDEQFDDFSKQGYCYFEGL